MPVPRKKMAPIDAPADGWLSITAAARALGVANATVYACAVRQELRTQCVGGRVFVHVDSVNEYLANHGVGPKAHAVAAM